MTSRAQRKGDAAERDVADRLAALTGLPVRRKLGAGRADDTGDLDGIPRWVLQVRHYADPQRAIRDGLAVLDTQQANARAQFAALLVRRPGTVDGPRWIAVVDLDRLADLILATTDLEVDP